MLTHMKHRHIKIYILFAIRSIIIFKSHSHVRPYVCFIYIKLFLKKNKDAGKKDNDL